ncbi:hypothetical protein AAY473_017580 [Plecturocebus cupreus]
MEAADIHCHAWEPQYRKLSWNRDLKSVKLVSPFAAQALSDEVTEAPREEVTSSEPLAVTGHARRRIWVS